MKIAIIGTYPPRQCGVATFTQDLYHALLAVTNAQISIFSVSDGSDTPLLSGVQYMIEQQEEGDYRRAALLLNHSYDICILQHEYGIFGGDAGSHIMTLVNTLKIPLITHFHTILKAGSSMQRRILQQLASSSDRVISMTQFGRQLLEDEYGIPQHKIIHIPHGVQLGQGRGLLFDFYDGNGLARQINKLLDSPRTMNKFRRRARRYGRGMQWPVVGRMYTALIQQVFGNKDHGADVFPETTLTNLPLFGTSTSTSIEVSSK